MQVSPFWRYSLTFIVLFLIFGFWFFFVHAAVAQRITHFQAEAEGLLQQKNICNTAQKKCSTLQKMIQAQELKLKTKANELGKTNSTHYTDHVISLITQHSLQLISCGVSNTQSDAPSLSLKTCGSWDNIQRFLTDFLQKEQAMSLEDLTVQKHETQFCITAHVVLHSINSIKK